MLCCPQASVPQLEGPWALAAQFGARLSQQVRLDVPGVVRSRVPGRGTGTISAGPRSAGAVGAGSPPVRATWCPARPERGEAAPGGPETALSALLLAHRPRRR